MGRYFRKKSGRTIEFRLLLDPNQKALFCKSSDFSIEDGHPRILRSNFLDIKPCALSKLVLSWCFLRLLTLKENVVLGDTQRRSNEFACIDHDLLHLRKLSATS